MAMAGSCRVERLARLSQRMPSTAAMAPRMRGARLSSTQPKSTSRSRLTAIMAKGHQIGCRSHCHWKPRSCAHAGSGASSQTIHMAGQGSRMMGSLLAFDGARRVHHRPSLGARRAANRGMMSARRDLSREASMNGAESLARTLVAGGVNVCFTNPGTSEMHFVAALDKVEGIRCVLGLFEGVVTGAADGYWRMAERPAATLLHLGPGLGNGLANLHNAKKASSAIVNIVGEHATHHIKHDAPLTSDIEGIARPVSHWVKTSTEARMVAADGAEAIAVASAPPGHIATLILPGDTAWNEGSGPVKVSAIPTRRKVAEEAVQHAAGVLAQGAGTMLLLSGAGVRERGLALA